MQECPNLHKVKKKKAQYFLARQLRGVLDSLHIITSDTDFILFILHLYHIY